MKTFPLIIAAALTGATAGFFLGRQPQLQRPAHQGGTSAQEAASLADGDGVSQSAIRKSTEADSSRPAPRPITAAQLSSELSNLQLFENFGASLRTLADLQERIRASDVRALAAEFCESNTMQKGPTGFLGNHLVLEALAEKDLQQAWQLATSGVSGPARNNAIMGVIGELVRNDPDRAFAMIASLPNAELRRQARSAAIGALATTDPARAFSLATAEPDSEANMAVMSVLSRWIRTDPEAAKAAAGSVQGPVGDQAREYLVVLLSHEDPVTAWEYAKQMPLTAESDPRPSVIAQWAKTDPRSALDAALTIPQSAKRNDAVGEAVGAWGETDFYAALSYATAVNDSGMRTEILNRLSRQSHADPQKMLNALLEHMPPGNSFATAVDRVVTSWAKDDRSAAAAALAALPAGSTQSRITQEFASSWLSSGGSPNEILRWAGGLPQGEAQKRAYAGLFTEWSKTNPQAAIQALSEISGPARTEAMKSIANGWSRRSPDDALRWAASAATSTPNERNSLIAASIRNMSESSPEKAAAVVASLPQAHRVEAMRSLINQWSSKNLPAAAQWLDKQPAGDAKDASLRSLADKIADDDPRSALSWAANISTTHKKLAAMEAVARQWMHNDPTAARAWITTSPLSPETRARLMK